MPSNRCYGRSSIGVLIGLLAVALLIAVSGILWYLNGPPAEKRKAREAAACATTYRAHGDMQSCLMLEYGWDEVDALSAELSREAQWRKQQEGR